ncbi:MAG TPA: hypothetical protein VF832_13130, partial [Longimicrobiales bacterium]
MLRSRSYFSLSLLALLAGAGDVRAQDAGAGAGAPALAPPPAGDTVARLLAARATLEHLGPTLGPSVWPGYRPDTIPTLLFVPRRGFLLTGWRGPLPAGYAAVQGGAAWRGVDAKGVASTGVELEGRGVAQAVVPAGLEAPPLVALMAHEAFHVFEQATHEAGAARQENSYYLSQYPVFDPVNDADAVLEGRLLAAALRAPTRDAALVAARRFLAVRESRQRRLDPAIAAFEEGAELNEGRAEYALVRAQAAAGGKSALAALGPRLDSLAQPERSVRLRFYATGSAQSLLLDRLAGTAWKDSLAAWGGTLQDALAHAVGYRSGEEALRRAAAAAYGGAELEAEARTRVAGLVARRRALADSLLARPGVLLVLSGDSVGGLGLCGFDPQNLLPA